MSGMTAWSRQRPHHVVSFDVSVLLWVKRTQVDDPARQPGVDNVGNMEEHRLMTGLRVTAVKQWLRETLVVFELLLTVLLMKILDDMAKTLAHTSDVTFSDERKKQQRKRRAQKAGEDWSLLQIEMRLRG